MKFAWPDTVADIAEVPEQHRGSYQRAAAGGWELTPEVAAIIAEMEREQRERHEREIAERRAEIERLRNQTRDLARLSAVRGAMEDADVPPKLIGAAARAFLGLHDVRAEQGPDGDIVARVHDAYGPRDVAPAVEDWLRTAPESAPFRPRHAPGTGPAGPLTERLRAAFGEPRNSNEAQPS